MKKVLTLCTGMLIAIALTSVNLMATMEIQKKHPKPGKGNAKINCAYCHTEAKIEKAKVGDKGRSGNAYCIDCHK